MENRPGLKKSSWWKRRTALEKALFIVVLFVSVAATVAVVMVTATLYGLFSGVEFGASSKDGYHSTENGHLAIENSNYLRRSERSMNVGSLVAVDADVTRNPSGNQAEPMQVEEKEERKMTEDVGEVNGRDGMRNRDGFGKKGSDRRRRRIKRWAPLVCYRCSNSKSQQKQRHPPLRPLASAGQAISRSRNNPNPAGTSKSNSEICFTADCVIKAAKMLESIDTTVDPCDDFYEYSCGMWNRLNTIPDDRPNFSTFRKLDDQLQSVLKELIEEPIKSSDIEAIKNVKNLYISCLDTTSLESKQDEPLKALLKEFGGWPILQSNWSEEDVDLSTLLATLKSAGHMVLMNSWVGADDKRSHINILQVDQPNLGMPNKENFLRGRDDKILMTYQTFATKVAQSLGADAETAARDIAAMVDFEIEVANITANEDQRRDTEAMYKKFRLKDLYGNLTDQIDWVKYFKTVFAPLNITVDENEEVVVYSTDYLRELGKLIKRTSKRTIINYAIWGMVIVRVNNLSQKYQDLRRDLTKLITGAEQERARWRGCVTYINENLQMAVGRMYVAKHFDELSKTRAIEMIVQLKAAFRENLHEVTWMEKGTKKFAEEKVDAIVGNIGYPDYIKNDTALNIEHEEIKVKPVQYFDNVVSILRIAVANNNKQLRQPVERNRWSSAPAVVNAFYSAPKNHITFPAGILQPPFYQEQYPMSLNFGGIGMVIGHEITHGFDDKGRQFDKDGNLKLWWSPRDVENFKAKAQCIIDQYNNYTVPEVGIKLNGRLTQGENIADNGGLKQAYRAYKNWKISNPPELKLPGLNHSHDQLFFLNFAQVWCGTSRPESYIQALRTSKHSPGRIRVIGSVSNSEDFAKAFNCPAGSQMNPVKKCSVW